MNFVCQQQQNLLNSKEKEPPFHVLRKRNNPFSNQKATSILIKHQLTIQN